MQKLDVILPCYNPIDGWEDTIVESVASIQEELPDIELFVCLVNDGASKGVYPENIQKLRDYLVNFQYISYSQNKGKGHALREGIRQSKHELCIFTDVDFPYTTSSFVNLFKALENDGMEVVVGTRNEKYYEKVPSARMVISKILKFFVRKFFSLPVSDTQCGLKGMTAKGKDIFLQTKTNRYLFDLEFIHLTAKQCPGKLSSVLVQLKPGIVFSPMNFRVLMQEGWSFLLIFFSNLFSRKKS